MSDEDSAEGCFGILILFIMAVWLCLTPFCCTDPEGTERALRQSGYHDIRTHGYRWFAGEDTYKTKFDATSPNGEHVTGVVTRGLWNKGSTIRLD